MTKTYAIADLHGRYDLLVAALAAIPFEVGDTLVVLGDFVDRGPQSREIVDLLMDMTGATGTVRGDKWRTVVLQGNHEAMMVNVLRGPTGEKMRWWIGNGGGQTLRSYGYESGDELLPLKVPESHLRWMEELPLYFEDAERVYVHAGVPAGKTAAEAHATLMGRDAMQWMLYGKADDGRGRLVPADNEGAPRDGKHVVHGHEQDAEHPLLLKHRTNLDTFAYHTGRLAVGMFEDGTAGGPVEVIWVEVM
jgi:serine/threonine protein phosphatase 1